MYSEKLKDDRERLGTLAGKLDSFRWDMSPSVDKATVLRLAKCDFICSDQLVVFWGPTAGGKSHIASAIQALAVNAGYSVETASPSCLELPQIDVSERKAFVECDLLIVDEAERLTHEQYILQERTGRSTLLLSKVGPDELLQQLLPQQRAFRYWGGNRSLVSVRFRQSNLCLVERGSQRRYV